MNYNDISKDNFLVRSTKSESVNVTYLDEETISKINRRISIKIKRNERHRSHNGEAAAKIFSK